MPGQLVLGGLMNQNARPRPMAPARGVGKRTRQACAQLCVPAPSPVSRCQAKPDGSVFLLAWAAPKGVGDAEKGGEWRVGNERLILFAATTALMRWTGRVGMCTASAVPEVSGRFI